VYQIKCPFNVLKKKLNPISLCASFSIIFNRTSAYKGSSQSISKIVIFTYINYQKYEFSLDLNFNALPLLRVKQENSQIKVCLPLDGPNKGPYTGEL